MTTHRGPHTGCKPPLHAAGCPDWHRNQDTCPRCRPARDEILPGPRLVCGCPLDSGCDGRHPGALGSASGGYE